MASPRAGSARGGLFQVPVVCGARMRAPYGAGGSPSQSAVGARHGEHPPGTWPAAGHSGAGCLRAAHVRPLRRQPVCLDQTSRQYRTVTSAVPLTGVVRELKSCRPAVSALSRPGGCCAHPRNRDRWRAPGRSSPMLPRPCPGGRAPCPDWNEPPRSRALS